jgi:hypothetical protein
LKKWFTEKNTVLAASFFGLSLTMERKALHPSETVSFYQNTQHRIPEDNFFIFTAMRTSDFTSGLFCNALSNI